MAPNAARGKFSHYGALDLPEQETASSQASQGSSTKYVVGLVAMSLAVTAAVFAMTAAPAGVATVNMGTAEVINTDIPAFSGDVNPIGTDCACKGACRQTKYKLKNKNVLRLCEVEMTTAHYTIHGDGSDGKKQICWGTDYSAAWQYESAARNLYTWDNRAVNKPNDDEVTATANPDKNKLEATKWYAACEVVSGRYDCWSFPCQNGGYCLDADNEYICSCKFGWEGVNCDVNIDECTAYSDTLQYPCARSARAITGPLSELTGKAQLVLDEATGEPRNLEAMTAECIDSDGSFKCQCIEGTEGTVTGSAYEGNGYNNLFCNPEGTEIADTGAYCATPPAWLAQRDEVPTGCQDVDDCAARPCANGGTCTDRGQETQLPTDAGTFTCACATGWVGDTCKEDIDECADKTHTCDPNADCINTPGAFDCICRIFEVAEPEFSGPGRMSGWEGPGFNPETEDGPPGCTDIPDCERFTPCQNGGTCAEGVQGSGQYACTCTYGWTNANCDIDENECENGVEDCHENAFCTNTDGSWACTCNDCYTGDGRYCFDADDCEFSPCANGGTCTDVGSCAFECDCLIGWRGKTCEDDWNECTMGIHTCHDDAICINNDGSFSCKCDTGFSGDGYRVCNDIDDCVYYQEAKPNFPIIGSNVCLHGVGGDGCVDAGPNIFICTCIKGWVDANCDMNDNECQNGRGEEEGQNRCHKYATCTNTEGSYTCRCNHGYTGDGTICTDISDCNGDTCGHGQCTDTGVGSFRCTCDEGWTDKTCSFNIDECSALTHECHDDATCDDGDGSYTCTCNIGYTGDGRGDCTDVDDCGSAPCEHGTCYDKGPAVYGCKCDQGWRDYNCDFDVNECYLGTHNCHIEGRCVNTPGGFYCRCLSGMEGDGYQTSHVHNGATAVDMFMERQCENEGGRIVTCKFKEQNSYDKVAKKKPELVDGLTFLGFYLNTEHQYRDHVGKSELIGTNAIGCVDLDDCDPARDGKGPPDDPCSPDYGDCKDMGRNKYYCECVRGWGGLDCMMDCNECEDGAGDPKCPGHTCTPNTATCENSAGSYMCMCQQDFWGTAYDDDVHNRIFPVYPGGCNPCTTCGVGYKVIRPCMQMEPEESKGKPNLDGTYRICGYQDGCGPERGAEPAFKNSHTQDSLCGDIDECADNLDNCDPRAKCINTVGSFTCTCMIDLQFWGDGITCQPCTTCGPGYKEEQDCTSLTDRICRLDLDDGLFLIQSQADDTPQCLMFDGEMKSYYPERYNWGYSDVLCGAIPSPLCSYKDKRWCQLQKLVEQREAVFRLTHITRDFYTIENNADGAGWRCLGFSHEGDWAYPELMTWGLPGDPLCGFAAANGATPEENLLVNGQAVWKLIPLNRHLTKFSLMIDATANDKADWACIFFDNGGQATNPSRAPTARSNGKWGHGGDFCGISCIAPECTDPIAKLLKNKQAVWILTPLCKKAKKANEKGANPEIIFDECPLDTEETGEVAE